MTAAIAAGGTAPDTLDVLGRMVLARETLAPSFREASTVAEGFAPDLWEDWCASALGLQRVNAGVACTLAFFAATTRLGRRGDLSTPVAVARAAQAICRQAGSRAATALTSATEALAGLVGADVDPVLTALVDLSQKRPEAVEPAISVLAQVLPVVGPSAYGEWLAAGLRAYATDKARLRAYVALEDPLARERLRDHGRAGALRRAMPEAIGFAAALSGEKPTIRFAHGAARASLAAPIVVMPESFPDVPAEEQGALAAAVLAHATAHRLFGGAPFDPRRLKPVQIALTSLIEDARVETLALRRFPGLARLWRPFHVIGPDTARTVPFLMARMARALFDPTYEDPEHWIAKARALFAAAGERLDDPAISREIGSLLGNDLGQMRLSFNAKTWVVDPIYRDDHAGLWTSERPPEAEATEIDVAVEAMRRTEEERDDGRPRDDLPPETDEAVGRARPAPAGEDGGTMIGRLPEWDHEAAQERPDWVTVRAYRPSPTAEEAVDRLSDAVAGPARRVEAMIRGARLGLPQRLKRQGEGDMLDLDAAIGAAIARRVGEAPDHRVYRRTDRKIRDLATLLLIDTSESTRDRLPGRSSRVLDVEIEATAVLATAIDALGDRLALEGFASDGREDVRITAVKDFAERFDTQSKARLAGLTPGRSTRLGAVLRHGGRRFAGQRAYRRLLVVITDGEPFDVDCDDPVYLVEDARRAVRELRSAGIDAFGLGIGATHTTGDRIFGRGNFVALARPEDLGKALSALYFRLASR